MNKRVILLIAFVIWCTWSSLAQLSTNLVSEGLAYPLTISAWTQGQIRPVLNPMRLIVRDRLEALPDTAVSVTFTNAQVAFITPQLPTNNLVVSSNCLPMVQWTSPNACTVIWGLDIMTIDSKGGMDLKERQLYATGTVSTAYQRVLTSFPFLTLPQGAQAICKLYLVSSNVSANVLSFDTHCLIPRLQAVIIEEPIIEEP